MTCLGKTHHLVQVEQLNFSFSSQHMQWLRSKLCPVTDFFGWQIDMTVVFIYRSTQGDQIVQHAFPNLKSDARGLYAQCFRPSRNEERCRQYDASTHNFHIRHFHCSCPYQPFLSPCCSNPTVHR